MKIEYYGNWGGPGHGEDGNAPIDRQDKAFMNHDKNYGKNGYFDHPSDMVLQAETTLSIFDPDSSWKSRAAGLGAVAIFGAMAPVSGLATTVVNPVANFFDDAVNKDPLTAVKNSFINTTVKPVETVVNFFRGLFG
jgi:hypothetical protein